MSANHPCVVWLTGLSGAGKTTLADALHARLAESGCRSAILDGDALRQGLSRDLGFSVADRAENVRRAAEVARLMFEAGLTVIVALISPARSARGQARALLPPGRFIEVFVDAPLALAEARDPKRLYRAARRGEIVDVAGLDLPYEAPLRPEAHVQTANLALADAVALLLAALPKAPSPIA